MVKIRLSRVGTKKRPYYRVVVADSRSKRDGRFIEVVGRYNPLGEKFCSIDGEKVLDWYKKGANPTETVKRLIKKAGIELVR